MPSALGFFGVHTGPIALAPAFLGAQTGPIAPTLAFLGAQDGPTAPALTFLGAQDGPTAPALTFLGAQDGPTAPAFAFLGAQGGPIASVPGFLGRQDGPTASTFGSVVGGCEPVGSVVPKVPKDLSISRPVRFGDAGSGLTPLGLCAIADGRATGFANVAAASATKPVFFAARVLALRVGLDLFIPMSRIPLSKESAAALSI